MKTYRTDPLRVIDGAEGLPYGIDPHDFAWLRVRHDHGTVSPAVYAAINRLESGIAWYEHEHQLAA